MGFHDFIDCEMTNATKKESECLPVQTSISGRLNLRQVLITTSDVMVGLMNKPDTVNLYPLKSTTNLGQHIVLALRVRRQYLRVIGADPPVFDVQRSAKANTQHMNTIDTSLDGC